MINKKLFTIYFSWIVLSLPLVTMADNYFQDVLNRLIYMVVWPVFVGLVIITFIFAGFLYLAARGEPGKLANANKALILAVVGVIIGIVAFSAQRILSDILGLTP